MRWTEKARKVVLNFDIKLQQQVRLLLIVFVAKGAGSEIFLICNFFYLVEETVYGVRI
ncbi:hypothetical protein JHK84_029164 [Glycine max]|nr:hypothetical protein JHK84_029164 [Glycine max]